MTILFFSLCNCSSGFVHSDNDESDSSPNSFLAVYRIKSFQLLASFLSNANYHLSTTTLSCSQSGSVAISDSDITYTSCSNTLEDDTVVQNGTLLGSISDSTTTITLSYTLTIDHVTFDSTLTNSGTLSLSDTGGVTLATSSSDSSNTFTISGILAKSSDLNTYSGSLNIVANETDFECELSGYTSDYDAFTDACDF